MDINGTLLWNDLNIFQYKVHFFKLDVDSHYFEPNLNQSITNEDWNLNEVRPCETRLEKTQINFKIFSGKKPIAGTNRMFGIFHRPR